MAVVLAFLVMKQFIVSVLHQPYGIGIAGNELINRQPLYGWWASDALLLAIDKDDFIELSVELLLPLLIGRELALAALALLGFGFGLRHIVLAVA